MPNRRMAWFLTMAAIGFAMGCVYGWTLRPPSAADSAPANLREDYQADYALMTAEIYAADADLSQARARLQVLNPNNPIEALQSALATARTLRYAPADLLLLETLLLRLQGAGS